MFTDEIMVPEYSFLALLVSPHLSIFQLLWNPHCSSLCLCCCCAVGLDCTKIYFAAASVLAAHLCHMMRISYLMLNSY